VLNGRVVRLSFDVFYLNVLCGPLVFAAHAVGAALSSATSEKVPSRRVGKFLLLAVKTSGRTSTRQQADAAGNAALSVVSYVNCCQ
jgi:hypothetical protein